MANIMDSWRNEWKSVGDYSNVTDTTLLLGASADIEDGTCEISDNFLNKACKIWFPNVPIDYITLLTVDKVDAEDQNKLDSKEGGAMTVVEIKNGVYGDVSRVCFNRKTAFTSQRRLCGVMGHELVHVSQYKNLKGSIAQTDPLKKVLFTDMLDYWAYAFQDKLVGGVLVNFTKEEIKTWCDEFDIELFTSLNYMNFPWTTKAEFKVFQ